MTKAARILLVEDETDILEANSFYLEALGYQVYSAINLEEARKLMWEYPPDLALLDIMLPDGSGLDFADEFRAYSKAPIIFLTCLEDDLDVLAGFDKGAADYVIKPYNMKILAARIAAQLQKKQANSRQIALPPLFIERDTGNITLDGQLIVLSPKELQILCYFVDMQGQEISQAQLYAAIWGNNEPSKMGSTVRTAVSRLRQKLNLDASDYFALQTTVNGGYVFLRIKYAAAEGANNER